MGELQGAEFNLFPGTFVEFVNGGADRLEEFRTDPAHFEHSFQQEAMIQLQMCRMFTNNAD